MTHKDLTWTQLEKLFELVQSRSIHIDGHPCILYDKTYNGLSVDCNYGKLYKPNRSCIYAHQVVFLYNVGYDDKVVHGIYPPDELSHLCHNSFCLNKEHIISEPQNTNKNRQKCNNRKVCSSNHIDYISKAKLPDCIIVPKL